MNEQIPQPRTRSQTTSRVGGGARDDYVFRPAFATTGALKVTVTNTFDVPMDVHLETHPIKPRAMSDRGGEKTAGADGGTATFDIEAPNTYYRAVIDWDTEASTSGEVTVEYEQKDTRRGVRVDEKYL